MSLIQSHALEGISKQIVYFGLLAGLLAWFIVGPILSALALAFGLIALAGGAKKISSLVVGGVGALDLAIVALTAVLGAPDATPTSFAGILLLIWSVIGKVGYIILGSVLLVVPGFLFSTSLFPKSGALDFWPRFGVSVGLGAMLVLYEAFATARLGALLLEPFITATVVVVVLFTVLTYLRGGLGIVLSYPKGAFSLARRVSGAAVEILRSGAPSITKRPEAAPPQKQPERHAGPPHEETRPLPEVARPEEKPPAPTEDSHAEKPEQGKPDVQT